MENIKHDQYDSIRLENQFCYPLYACAKEVVRQYRKPLASLDLTYTQYIVMMVLWEFGGMTEGELGRIVRLESGTLAPLLKRLEKQGLIERIRPESNERKLFLKLTPDGEMLKQKALAVPSAMQNCIQLPKEELLLLRELLNKALHSMERGESGNGSELDFSFRQDSLQRRNLTGNSFVSTEVFFMKKIMAVLLVILLCIISACMADEIPEETICQLKEHCYINPNGGNKLHVYQNCESVNPRYLPLTEIEFNETLLNQYSVCPVCTAVGQPQQEPSLLDRATKVMSEEEIYRITVEWEKKYSFSGLWDYQVNAAFSAETRTIPYNPYVFDFSLLPVMPDEDAIPAEKIAEDAVSLAASYGSRLTENDLENMQVIVSQYVKPDKDVYLFSTNGSWLVNFWKDDENFACLYVDAHTGIPNFFYLIQDGIQYIGEPGVEPRID